MADIPGSAVKMNDIEISANAPLTEALFNKMGANINYFIDKTMQEEVFTANGSWTCPPLVTYVWLTMIGGGGGGGSGAVGGSFTGGGGGGGGSIFQGVVPVIPGTIYPIIVGAGGAGGAGTGGNNGSHGGPSSALGISVLGGYLGGGGTTTGVSGSAGIGGITSKGYRSAGGPGNAAGVTGDAGEDNFYAAAGPGTAPPSVTFAGAGGGGAGFDAGGSQSTTIHGTRGSGGGGSLGTNVGATAAGGNGGDGIVYIRWYGDPA